MKRFGACLVFLAACETGEREHVELRAAVDRAERSLSQTVAIAEASVQRSAGVNARIHQELDQFAISAVASGVRHEIRVDFAGLVVSALAAGSASAGCSTQITLADALAIAETATGGDAVQVVPDDDDPCLREIQVLVDTTLWEVKVGPTGSIIETELSDEEL